jgi:hypothetical protein
VVPFFARHRNYTFQHDQVRSNSERATGDFLQQNNIEVMAWYTFSLWAEIQNDKMKSNQGKQLQLNLMNHSWGFGIVCSIYN